MKYESKIPFQNKALLSACQKLFEKTEDQNTYHSTLLAFTKSKGTGFNMTYPFSINIHSLETQTRFSLNISMTKAYITYIASWVILSGMFYLPTSNAIVSMFLGLIGPIYVSISIGKSIKKAIEKIEQKIIQTVKP